MFLAFFQTIERMMFTRVQRRHGATKARLCALGLLFAIASCARPAPSALPIAQWQFIDAETMQPIEGAFVNFAWRGKATARGLQTCKRGVLKRSDKNGWVRDTALDASWHVDATPSFFVPGYEFFPYRYGYPDENHVTHYIKQDANQEFGRYPAWEKSWVKMGYVYQGEKSAQYLEWHAWTKVLPAVGFHDFQRDLENPRRYFMKLRTIPAQVGAAFSFVGKTCDDVDATNSVDIVAVREADYLRGYHSTKYFCDTAWNSLPPGRWDMTEWIRRATWLLPAGSGFKPFELAMPEYFNPARSMSNGNLSPEERRKFCDIVNQYLKVGETL
jgi:hypothetical protein